MLSVKWWYCIVNQNITILIHSLYSISILITCSFLLAYACVRPFALTCIYIPPTSPKGYYPSVPILLLGSLGIGKRYFESRSNSYFLNPFLDGLLISPEISKVSFELLKGFSVTPEKWKQQGMFWVTQNLSGYTRKPCRRASSPKSGSLMFHLSTIYIQTYYFPNDLNILVMQRFFCSMFGWT